MGNFANTLFSVLLGWVQNAIMWLWQLIGQSADGSAGGLLSWMLEHWLLLVIGVCAVGLAIDLVVYLVRWQPYRVWRSRRSREEEEPPEEEEAVHELQWLYANGDTGPVRAMEEDASMETLPSPKPPEQQRKPRRLLRRRRGSAPGEEASQQARVEGRTGYHQPYYPPQWQTGEHPPTHGGTEA